jgi:hypothetical protein
VAESGGAKERDSSVSPTSRPVLGVGRAELFKRGRGEDSGRVQSVNSAKKGGDDTEASVPSAVSSLSASMDQSPVLDVGREEFESDLVAGGGGGEDGGREVDGAAGDRCTQVDIPSDTPFEHLLLVDGGTPPTGQTCAS